MAGDMDNCDFIQYIPDWFTCTTEELICLDEIFYAMEDDMHDDYGEDYMMTCDPDTDAMCAALLEMPMWECDDGTMDCPPPLVAM